jgi:heparanase 1
VSLLSFLCAANSTIKKSLIFVLLGVLFFVSKNRALDLFYQLKVIDLIASLVFAQGPPPAVDFGQRVDLEFLDTQPLGRVSEKYLSFAIDTSQVVGGRWWGASGEIEVGTGSHHTQPFDFSDKKLIALTRELSPAFLRIGGTEADLVYYDVDSSLASDLPRGFDLVFKKDQIDALAAFVEETQLSLFFTVNAGPGPRSEGRWNSQNAEKLLRYMKSKDYPVEVWELGNEPNAYWIIHGLRHQIDGKTYADDFLHFKKTVKRFFPSASVAGASCAYWPLLGEPLNFFFGVHKDFLKAGGDHVDIVTWHYYPQQSRRCGVAVRRANPDRMLDPRNLDEMVKWSLQVNAEQAEYASQAEVWLGETGHAQCGGEPGVSDTFVGSLWWLDQLALGARLGQKVMVRQTLAGSDYGLIDHASMEPLPDYWSSLLWKRLMGEDVYAIENAGGNPYIRVYAHTTARRAGFSEDAITLLIINLHKEGTAHVTIPKTKFTQKTVYGLSADDIYGSEVNINGNPLVFESGKMPDLLALGEAGDSASPEMAIAPTSIQFIVLHD